MTNTNSVVAADGAATNDEVPINTDSADQESPPTEIDWAKVGKFLFSRGFAFLLGIVVAVILFYYDHQILAILSLLIGIIIAGYQKVPTFHRGVWTFFGQRLPVAISAGLRFRIPFWGGVILIDTRDRTEKLSYEKFVGNDGIPFSFTLFFVWHKARREDEKNWTWFKPWTWGPMIRAITNLEEGAAKRLVMSLGKNRAEVELVKHSHNEVLGFSISELEELFKRDLESAQTVPAISVSHSENADSIRNLIAETVMKELNERLNKRGIVISEVAFEDFNLPAEMLKYIQEILRTKFEKASEMIDVKIDMKRVIMLMEEAQKSGVTLDFIDAYKVMRGLDIGEIAAKQGGQLGLFLQGLIGKNSPLPEAVQNKIQLA